MDRIGSCSSDYCTRRHGSARFSAASRDSRRSGIVAQQSFILNSLDENGKQKLASMTSTTPARQLGAAIMRHKATLVYAIVSYAIFLFTFLYAVGFTSGAVVPKALDTGDSAQPWLAAAINVLLLSLFAIQHSVMARKEFKNWVTKFVPATIERSTYVLCASLILLLLFWQWQPIATTVWRVEREPLATLLFGLCFLGWLIVLASTFMISHFELFGLKQALSHAARSVEQPRLTTPLLYKVVRHPIYLGFIIAFWATPTMTLGHLLFATVTTAYIFIGIALEEKDLIALFGDEYLRYRRRVAMIVPWRFN
jgi:protein-S-isoprenylcysteine O-methyltransferase Ste14